MANYYAQVSLDAASGETADVNVNTFAFQGPSSFGPTEADHFADSVELFYNALYTSGALLGRTLAGHSIKIYVATTVPPNYPIDEASFSLPDTPAGIELPLEVSLCVSYANDSATIVPRARRRGRIYVSGFMEAANTAGRPTTAIVEDLADAYKAYVDALNADTDFVACIWSRTNASLYPIERIYVDNEWDTMRSRGGKSTSRYTVAPA